MYAVASVRTTQLLLDATMRPYWWGDVVSTSSPVATTRRVLGMKSNNNNDDDDNDTRQAELPSRSRGARGGVGANRSPRGTTARVTSVAAVDPVHVVVDVCATYAALCQRLLDRIGCPATQRGDGSLICAVAGNTSAAAALAVYQPNCVCGGLGGAADRVHGYVVDAVLAAHVSERQFVPPPNAPYSLFAASNPFRPLLSGTLGGAIPGFNT